MRARLRIQQYHFKYITLYVQMYTRKLCFLTVLLYLNINNITEFIYVYHVIDFGVDIF